MATTGARRQAFFTLRILENRLVLPDLNLGVGMG